jgi:hypothetical protein
MALLVGSAIAWNTSRLIIHADCFSNRSVANINAIIWLRKFFFRAFLPAFGQGSSDRGPGSEQTDFF